MATNDEIAATLAVTKSLVEMVKVDTQRIREDMVSLDTRVRGCEIAVARLGERVGSTEKEIATLRLWDRGQALFTAAASSLAAFLGYGR